MNHTEAIKQLMIDTGARQADLVKQLGVSRAVISGRINQENIGMKVFLEMLDAFGYEIVVRKASGSYQEGEYPIRFSDYQRGGNPNGGEAVVPTDL